MANADDTAGDSVDVLQRIGTQGARSRLSKKDEQRCSRLTRSFESVPIRQLLRSLSSLTILQVLSSQHGVTIVLGDVDHFRKVNATYGDAADNDSCAKLPIVYTTWSAVPRAFAMPSRRVPWKACGSCAGFDEFGSGRHRRLAGTER